MASLIKLKKGLNIALEGVPQQNMASVKEDTSWTFVPDDFNGLTPKILVRADEPVAAGQPIVCDKLHPEIQIVSPVSGTLVAVNRGERRKVLSVVVKKDGKCTSTSLPAIDAQKASAEEVRKAMLERGVWPFLVQRPYCTIADPTILPRDIFVTLLDTAPLAPSFEMIVKGQEAALQAGITALSKLTSGKVYVGVAARTQLNLKDCEIYEFEGAHPAGNVGVQINHIKPINKGEKVWTATAQDVIVIGRVLAGNLDFSRVITIAGSEILSPAYAKVLPGSSIESIVAGKVKQAEYLQRYINGNVLTGENAGREGTLGAQAQTVTVIPDGSDNAELFGWATPGITRYSVSRSSLSAFLPKKLWTLDARLKGGRRALIASGDWEKVFPMDIYPEHLFKAALAFDIDKMEELGIYEVAPEDFALCEFVDASKTPVMQVIADALKRLKKEME